MGIKGIAWHAVVADGEVFDSTRQFFTDLLGGGPAWEADGYTAFLTPDGSNLELLSPTHLPAYGLNAGVAFGFLVDDLDEASVGVEAAGGALIGDVVRTDVVAYRHFQDPAGRTYALTQRLG
ncbi:VOC family protein [Streptomyces acidicola]|uniref:VOC family protein n=1 Tax=Streptomyces acidicola TaxID=2596892 RepID=UPI0037F19F69